MGIQNRDGALYFATGIDNTGFYKGKQEAIGIIRSMMSQVTSFDVFGGIGISAAMAFGKAAKDSYNFSKEFEKNMLEVSTISSEISVNFEKYQQGVINMTKVIPVAANDSAKALYQIVSAGHDGAAGMQILEASAKAAVGGVTDTATAADAITTLINAYKKSADDANTISDQLFTTARLGKTTFGELGQSIAQAAPLAAAYGVEMDQVLAAVATLTKSGTPTAQAMTQIRASIVGVSKVLGDGAFDTMTYQEALAEVAKRAGGSESKLRELIPEIEAVNGVLGLTGINAQMAASDLGEMNNSVGATEVAFRKMADGTDAQLQLLQNNIVAATRPMGEAIMKQVASVANSLNEAFANGDIEKSVDTLKTLITLLAGAFVTYKIATNMSAIQTKAETVATNILSNVKQAYHKVIGEGIVEKERERVMQETYILELEKTLTAEQQVQLSKMNLTKGSKEYGDALSNLMIKERDGAKSQIDSITKSIAKQKEKLSVAQQNLQQMDDVVAMRKRDMAAAVASNDLTAVATAQEKLSTAEISRNAAARSVQSLQGKVTAQQNVLNTVTTRATTAATAIDTATTSANSAAKKVATSASFRLAVSMKALGASMAANPLGALLTVVSLAVTAFMMFRREVKSTEDIINDLDKTTQNYANGADRITKLADDYETLKGKVNRTDEENKKLKTTIDSLAGTIPGVVTEFDKYGKALDVNIEKVRQFSKEQQEANKWALDGDIETGEKRLKELDRKIERQRKIYQDGKVTRISYTPSGMGPATVTSYEDKATNEERVKAGTEAQGLFEERNKLNEQLTKSRDTLNAIAEQHNKDAFNTLSSDLVNYTDGIAEAKIRLENLENSGVWTEETSREIENTKSVIKELGELKLLTEEKIKTFTKTAVDPTPVEQETVGVRVKKIQGELAAAEKDLITSRSKDSTKTAAEIEAAEKSVKDLKGKLATLTGVTDKRSSSTKKTYEELSKLIKDSEIKLQSEQLAIMADGKNKMLAQSKSEHDEREAAIQKDYDDQVKKYKEIGKGTPEEVNVNYKQRLNTNDQAWEKRDSEIEKNSTKEIAEWYKELTGIFETEESRKIQAINARYEKEKEWLQKQKDSGGVTEEEFTNYSIKIDEAKTKEQYSSLLADLNDFKYQEEQLTKEWDAKIAAAGDNTDLAGRLQKGKDKALGELNGQALMKSDEWSMLFDDLDNLTVTKIDELVNTIQSKAKDMNLDPVNLKVVTDNLNKAKQKVVEINPFKALGESFKDVFKKGSKDSDKSSKDVQKDWKSLAKSTEGCFAFINDAVSGCSVLSDILGESGQQTMQMIMGIATAGIAMATAIKTAETASVVLTAISVALSVVTALFSMFNKDKQHEKKIQSIQKEVQKLERAYDKLGKAIDKSYSSQKVGLIDQQEANLKKQQELLKQQIAEEQAKKKTDQGKIDEWKNQIEDLNDEIAEMKERRIEAIMGTDVQSALDDFASAYAEAWAAGEDKRKAIKDVVKDMIKGAVIEMIKMRMNPEVGKLMEFLSTAVTDGIDSTEQSIIDKMTENIYQSAEAATKGLEQFLDDPEKAAEAKKEAGFAGAVRKELTEETGSELTGLFRGYYDLSKQSLEVDKQSIEIQRATSFNTSEILKVNQQIATNTGLTVTELQGMREDLQKIGERLGIIGDNAKSPQSDRDLGL